MYEILFIPSYIDWAGCCSDLIDGLTMCQEMGGILAVAKPLLSDLAWHRMKEERGLRCVCFVMVSLRERVCASLGVTGF